MKVVGKLWGRGYRKKKSGELGDDDDGLNQKSKLMDACTNAVTFHFGLSQFTMGNYHPIMAQDCSIALFKSQHVSIVLVLVVL
jgi:hypothetical protein